MATSNELRIALLNTIEDVSNKKITAQEAIAIAKLAQTAINLTRLELDFMQIGSASGDIKFLSQENGDS